MQINDGGPAFPIPSVGTGDPRDGMTTGHPGMSLRDWFAGQALIGIASRVATGVVSASRSIKVAYEFADMMLDERERKQRESAAMEHYFSEKQPFDVCVEWAKKNGLKNTRALNVIGSAGINSFSQISREVLEETQSCGAKTIALIMTWKRESQREAKND